MPRTGTLTTVQNNAAFFHLARSRSLSGLGSAQVGSMQKASDLLSSLFNGRAVFLMPPIDTKKPPGPLRPSPRVWCPLVDVKQPQLWLVLSQSIHGCSWTSSADGTHTPKFQSYVCRFIRSGRARNAQLINLQYSSPLTHAGALSLDSYGVLQLNDSLLRSCRPNPLRRLGTVSPSSAPSTESYSNCLADSCWH